jgi:hypothetical protein
MGKQRTAPAALARMARRVEADPFFLASAFAAWKARHHAPHGRDGSLELCEALGLDLAAPAPDVGDLGAWYAGRSARAEEALAPLALCRRPGSNGEDPGPGIARIAGRFGIDAARLAAILEEAERFGPDHEEGDHCPAPSASRWGGPATSASRARPISRTPPTSPSTS